MSSLYITKENILSKIYFKNEAWKLVSGPFIFLKNHLQKGTRESLYTGSEIPELKK